MQFADVVHQRCSVKTYDPEHELSDDDLKQLFALTVRAPSSFNLQHWRFVVLRDPERRAAVQAAAWGQKQITEASVTIVIVGKLAAHDDAARIYANTPPEVQAKLVPMIGGFYATNDQLQRDEAIRSGSLAAMVLMLAAVEMGLSTCPMIGFDPKKVAEICRIDEDTHVPIMLVTLGKQRGDKPYHTGRLPLSEVVTFDTLDGEPLAD